MSRVVDTGSCRGISVESCTRSQNQGIPGQPGAITMIRQWHCLILDHPVKESHWRVSISSESHPIYVQSIYVPGLWVWDKRHVKREFVVQVSGKQVYLRSEPLVTDLFEHLWVQ